MPVKVRYSDELYHHGILGQKWGVRRYQNEDGTLTPEGRLRYLHSTTKSELLKNRDQISRDAREVLSKGNVSIQKSKLNSSDNKALIKKLMTSVRDESMLQYMAYIVEQGGNIEISLKRPSFKELLTDYEWEVGRPIKWYYGSEGHGKNKVYISVTNPYASEEWKRYSDLCARSDTRDYNEEKEFWRLGKKLESGASDLFYRVINGGNHK